MNNQNATLLLAATLVTVLNFQSCKKYEDGPSFSLRSKTARLTGDWEVVRIDTVEYPNNGYSLEFEFDKDGDFTFQYSYTDFNFINYVFNYTGQSYAYAYVGDWEFSSDKSEIEIIINNQVIDFEIKKLTNKDLWIEDVYGAFTGGVNDEWRLEKK